MKRKAYSVLALDLDGTLTNSQKEISARNLEALMRAQEAGVRVVLASGRPIFGIRPLAEQLGIAKFGGYILAFNGGAIIDCASGNAIAETTLPREVVPQLYQAAKEAGLTIVTCSQTTILSDKPEDEYVKKMAFLNRAAVEYLPNFLEQIPRKVPKCLIAGHQDVVEALERDLAPRLAHVANIFRSEPFFLEIVPRGIDKAASLEKLCRHLGITAAEMIACGDGFNDLSMIEYAGLGVAMGNAQPAVREAADVIAPTNDEDGVAWVVEQYLLPALER